MVGSLHWGVYIQGVLHPEGVCIHGAVGQRAGGAHPTGMHSCSKCIYLFYLKGKGIL